MTLITVKRYQSHTIVKAMAYQSALPLLIVLRSTWLAAIDSDLLPFCIEIIVCCSATRAFLPHRRPGQDQNLNLQLDDLKKAGCYKIFQEKVSSAKERPQLRKLLEILREGDTVIVWKLDRLGRSLKELFTLVNDFQTNGIGFRSLNDAIDTTTAQGRLVFNLFTSLAEFERDLIRERTKAGLAAARARGRIGGRPKGLSAEAQTKARAVKSIHALKTHTILEIGQLFNLSRATVYRYLA